jgi:type I restriction enzyme S subunit
VPLVSSTGHGNASLNRLHYQEGRFALGTILVAIFPHDSNLISARFIFEYLSAFKDELLVARMTGTANVTLSVGRVAEVPVPLVCPEVQAKVDELMALCDRLEESRTAREAVRDRLTVASLARLTAPDTTAADFQSHARFALQSLPTLTTRPDQIKPLRQTILNLAVRGKLVEQDAADEPAAELLKRIAKGKAHRVKTRFIPKKAEPVRDPLWHYVVDPTGWQRIALGQVTDLVTSGSRGWGEFYSSSGPGFLRAQNIRFGKLRLDDLACVTPPSNSEGSRTQVSLNDLLVVITGAGVTNPALLERDLGVAYVSQHVGLVRPSDTSLSPWLLMCLMADAGGRAELVARAYGAGKPGLNLENIRNLTIPLPPLAEQHRIVAKVDALMDLCDRLEASLTQADTTRQRLLAALLHEALDPAAQELEAAE